MTEVAVAPPPEADSKQHRLLRIAAWIIFVILLPYLGVLIYLIANHDGMADRNLAQMQQQKAATDDYIRSVSGGAAGEIEKAKGLLDSGAITQAEFDSIKAKALASG